MRRLLALALFAPSLLLAQEPGGARARPEVVDQDTGGPAPRRAYAIGIVGYGGGPWVPNGVELAALWGLGERGRTSVGATLSLGTFAQSQAILFGTTSGFYAALGATARQALVDLVDMGTERRPGVLRLEVAAEAALSADLATPLPQGRWDLRLGLLPGLAYGSETGLGQSVGVFFGPAVFIGKVATTHTELAIRFRMPVG